MIKLVALDLDGTIVNEELEISPATTSLLRKIQAEKQIKVVLATGRMFPSALPFAYQLGLMDPVISYQGAMIRDINQFQENAKHYPTLFHQAIDVNVAKTIVDLIHEHAFHANMYVDDQLFTTELNQHSLYYQKISGVVPQEARNLHTVLTGPPSKFMIIDDRCDEIIDILHNQFSNSVSICKSRHNFCEIVHASVSKWRAIERLMEQWDITADEVMAVGDQENDLSMIKGAGVGVAMGSAPDHVKAQAHYVTETVDEDGVVKAIHKFVYGIENGANPSLNKDKTGENRTRI